MFDKEIFKTDLINFLKKSIPLCEKYSKSLIIEELKQPEFFSTGKYKKFNFVKKSNYDFFITKTLKNELTSLNEYKILIKFFVTKEFKNYNAKLLGTSYEKIPSKPNFAYELPLKFLVEYLKHHEDFSISKKIFDKVFESFFLFLENLLEDEYIAPLFNFESNISKHGVTINDICIRKINESEFSIFSNLEENVHLQNIFHNLTHVMTIQYPSSDLNSGYELIKEKFQRVLDSLSLLKEGNPRFGGIYRNINNPWIHYDSKYEIDVILRNPLKMKKTEKKLVTQIYDGLNLIDFSQKGNKFLEIAKKRFVTGLSRTSKTDQLIDLMISLESLYVSSPGEITVRLSNRIATVLGKNDLDRENIWRFIKKVYNMRSGIVHGEGLRSNEINGKIYTLDEIIEKLIQMNRHSIMIFMKLVNHYNENNKIDRISDDIDKALINRIFLKKLKIKFN
jgi:hypothetical protein